MKDASDTKIVKQHPTLPAVWVDGEGTVFLRLTATPSIDDYHQVKLSYNEKVKMVRRSTLVCEAWHGVAPQAGLKVLHKNGNTVDDHPDNLEWGKRRAKPRLEISKADVIAIRRRRAAGENGNALAAEFGVSPSHVSGIHTGKLWSWMKEK